MNAIPLGFNAAIVSRCIYTRNPQIAFNTHNGSHHSSSSFASDIDTGRLAGVSTRSIFISCRPFSIDRCNQIIPAPLHRRRTCVCVCDMRACRQTYECLPQCSSPYSFLITFIFLLSFSVWIAVRHRSLQHTVLIAAVHEVRHRRWRGQWPARINISFLFFCRHTDTDTHHLERFSMDGSSHIPIEDIVISAGHLFQSGPFIASRPHSIRNSRLRAD